MQQKKVDQYVTIAASIPDLLIPVYISFLSPHPFPLVPLYFFPPSRYSSRTRTDEERERERERGVETCTVN